MLPKWRLRSPHRDRRFARETTKKLKKCCLEDKKRRMLKKPPKIILQELGEQGGESSCLEFW